MSEFDGFEEEPTELSERGGTTEDVSLADELPASGSVDSERSVGGAIPPAPRSESSERPFRGPDPKGGRKWVLEERPQAGATGESRPRGQGRSRPGRSSSACTAYAPAGTRCKICGEVHK